MAETADDFVKAWEKAGNGFVRAPRTSRQRIPRRGSQVEGTGPRFAPSVE
jgi:hypothetical protein